MRGYRSFLIEIITRDPTDSKNFHAIGGQYDVAFRKSGHKIE